QFGELIEAEPAEERAERRHPFVVGERPTGRVARVAHGAELVDLEDAAAEAGAFLAKEDRRAERGPDRGPGDEERGREDGEPGGRRRDVEGALGDPSGERHETSLARSASVRSRSAAVP